MLDNQTAAKLRDLRLGAMAEAYLNPEPGTEGLSFEDRFSLIVEKEWYAKKRTRVGRLLRLAGFSMHATLEGVDYCKGRNISRREVASLGTCAFIERKLNVILSGKTGAGKSYLACAIGDAACRHNYSCKYYRMPDLLAEIELARLEHRYLRFMEALRKVRLLIIDDLGMRPFGHEEARDLLEIAEARYNRTSTIFSSQTPHGGWYDLIPDPTIADAFMDRVVHNAVIVHLDSEISMRKVMAGRGAPCEEPSGEGRDPGAHGVP